MLRAISRTSSHAPSFFGNDIQHHKMQQQPACSNPTPNSGAQAPLATPPSFPLSSSFCVFCFCFLFFFFLQWLATSILTNHRTAAPTNQTNQPTNNNNNKRKTARRSNHQIPPPLSNTTNKQTKTSKQTGKAKLALKRASHVHVLRTTQAQAACRLGGAVVGPLKGGLARSTRGCYQVCCKVFPRRIQPERKPNCTSRKEACHNPARGTQPSAIPSTACH